MNLNRFFLISMNHSWWIDEKSSRSFENLMFVVVFSFDVFFFRARLTNDVSSSKLRFSTLLKFVFESMIEIMNVEKLSVESSVCFDANIMIKICEICRKAISKRVCKKAISKKSDIETKAISKRVSYYVKVKKKMWNKWKNKRKYEKKNMKNQNSCD